MKTKNVIIGSGVHAHVLFYDLSAKKDTFMLSLDNPKNSKNILIDNCDEILQLKKNASFFFGIGGIDLKGMRNRKKVFLKYTEKSKIIFGNFVSSTAVVKKNSLKSTGLVIMAGATLQYNVELGDNVIINTGAIIEHDAKIGAHSHIGPGVTICGSVHIGETVLVGAGSTVIQGLQIGDRSILAAGSVLTTNIPKNELWAGSPARKIKGL